MRLAGFVVHTDLGNMMGATQHVICHHQFWKWMKMWTKVDHSWLAHMWESHYNNNSAMVMEKRGKYIDILRVSSNIANYRNIPFVRSTTISWKKMGSLATEVISTLSSGEVS